VFSKFDNKYKFLILKRADDDDVYPGIWQICTGTREENENTLVAALRELKEETGIEKFINLWNVPKVASYYSVKRDAVAFSPVFALEIEPTSQIKISNEHTAFQWISKEKAQEILFIPSYIESINTVCEYILNVATSKLFLIEPNIYK
jgi:8-oxo-dGTP pyrophosphatase MutT (NUDIX family)